MGAVATESSMDRSAYDIMQAAKKVADYDQALFETPELKGKLLDLARETISSPAALPSARREAYNLYEAFEHIISRGLWQEPKFAEFTSNLLNHENPKVKALFIDCLHKSNLINSYDSGAIFDKTPNLLTQVLNAAESTKSETALVQTIEIFTQAGKERIAQTNLDKLLSLIEKTPGAEVLAAAACLFANNPNQKFSLIAQANFEKLENLDLKDQAVLRYLLNHSPSSEVVRKTVEVGLNFRTEYDRYPGKAGLLEAALYLKEHRLEYGLSFVGLGNLFDGITNRRLGPGNYSEEAAVRFMSDNLKGGQPVKAIVLAYNALGASQNPAALSYLEKVSTQPNFFQKAINTLTLSWGNICNSHTRLSAAIQGLKNNTVEQALALREKLSFRIANKTATNFYGW